MIWIAFIPVLLWTAGALFTARAARAFELAQVNRLRLAMALALLGGWVTARASWPSNAIVWSWLLISGGLGLGLGDLAMMASYRLIGPRVGVLILSCLAVPTTGVAEWLLLGTRLTAREIIWCVGILVGVSLAAAPGARIPAKDRSALLWGWGFGIVAALTQGTAATLSRVAYHHAAERAVPMDGITATAQRMIGGLIFMALVEGVRQARHILLPPVALAAEISLRSTSKPRRAWGALVGATLCGPVLGLSAYQWALLHVPSALVQAIASLVPVTVIPLAWVVENDRADRRGMAGAIIACCFAVLLALDRR